MIEQIINRVILYFVLFISIIVTSLLSTPFMIMLFEDRGNGMFWGIICGTFLGFFPTILFFDLIKKNVSNFFDILFKGVIYSIFIFSFSYLVIKQLNIDIKEIIFVLLTLSIIISFEISMIKSIKISMFKRKNKEAITNIK